MPSRLAAARLLLAGPPRSNLPIAVQRVQVHLLLQKTDPFRLLSPIPFAVPLALVFHQHWDSFTPLAWAMLFVLASGWCFVRRMKLDGQDAIRDADIPAVLRRRTQDIFLLGAMWGLAPWMLDPHGDVAYLTLSALFVVGAVAIGSMIVTTHRQAISAFSIPAGIGMVTACASFGGPVGWLIASCGALFVLVTLGWAFQQADLLQDSLVVRFEKEDLARRLAHQVDLFEAANREKTRFFAAASHDLRQPMHAISLFISSLERARLGEGEAQTVAQLSNSVQALAHSLDTMLDVSRLDAGAVQPVIEPVPVHELFLSLQNTFAGRAQEKGLHLRLRAPGRLAVLSDRLLLERLLANLVDNAIKYTQAGGVLVAARTGASRDPAQVCFEIVDTGVGLPQEQQQRVFDEFYQVGNPQRDRRMGLGIGLSIVRRLSELLGHPVALRSTAGRGTRFTVRVPRAVVPALAPAAAVRPDPKPAPPPDKLPKHVLVVDDEIDSRQAMASWLASHGCLVSTAGSLPQAEDVLRREAVHVVIADFRLPGERSGLDFLVALRAQAPQIRTLLVTGETAPHRISAIRASGVPCLYKPVR
ncbi:MAG TPA: hybrid sensor histidine kinase/response regulator, partial [Ramlibacter sp.]|nr:hybrid sensor histidine kinase/response regulator [Ramlibacter sp.]